VPPSTRVVSAGLSSVRASEYKPAMVYRVEGGTPTLPDPPPPTPSERSADSDWALFAGWRCCSTDPFERRGVGNACSVPAEESGLTLGLAPGPLTPPDFLVVSGAAATALLQASGATTLC